MKKCLYCSSEIPVDRVIDICNRCGKNVWDEKMFNAIVQNMENARANGDLCHHTSHVAEPRRELDDFERFR